MAEHGPVVLRVCRALLPPGDADDAWSETFLAALRAYPELPDGSNVRGWLVTIAHRGPSTSSAGPTAHRAAAAPSRTPPRPTASPTRSTTTSGCALRRLPPKQQAAVVAHHLAGLPVREVGRLLDSSEAAARRSAADGIAALRTTYRKDPRR